jgi:hypothetical protein
MMVVNTEDFFSRFQRTKRAFLKKSRNDGDYALAYALMCVAENGAEINRQYEEHAENLKEMSAEIRTIRRINMFNSFRGY